MGQEFPKPDEVFQERYRIVSVIDRGGFARVYRAKQLELNRDVAIKVLQPVRRTGADRSDEEARLEVIAKRFTREAQLVSQLRDNHTVTMHDYGTTDDGLLYMVLEYINGDPLDRLIALEGALTPERAVKITRQILSSLEEAHALGMLHRDIKPGNVMLFDHAGRTDQVKVLDFGLAKSVESREFTADDPDLTGDEVILGTPRYMSPEQIRGDHLDARTDIYSLGLVVYEMLTGFKAVEGDSTMQTLARHLNDVPIQLPATLVVPPKLRRIVNRMLLKEIDGRFDSARDVLDALESWRDDGDQAHAVTLDSRFGDAAPAVSGDSPPDDSRRNAVIGVAAVMGLFLLIAIASTFTGSSDTQATVDADHDGEIAENREPNSDEEPTSEESVVAEVREEEGAMKFGGGSENDSDVVDPFEKAGVPDLPPEEEKESESADGDAAPEAPPDEPSNAGDTAEESPAEDPPDSVDDPSDRDRSNTDSTRNRSTKPRESGKTKENKLKLRVLQ